jgi:hypothetical protein
MLIEKGALVGTFYSIFMNNYLLFFDTSAACFGPMAAIFRERLLAKEYILI